MGFKPQTPPSEETLYAIIAHETKILRNNLAFICCLLTFEITLRNEQTNYIL